MNSGPEITRRDEIFPDTENYGISKDREKFARVSEYRSMVGRMIFFCRKVGFFTQMGGVSQPDNKEINKLSGLHNRYATV